MTATDRGYATLLADLANEYERSRDFLAQLEDSLKGRAAVPVAEVDAVDDKEQDYDEEEQAPAFAMPQDPASDSPNSPGFRWKLSNFFSRKLATSPTVRCGQMEDIIQHSAVLSPGNVPTDAHDCSEPKRTSSLYKLGSTAQQRAPSLNRLGPRMALDVRQQLLQDNFEPKRSNFSNLGHFQPTLRRKSMENLGTAGRRASLEVLHPVSANKTSIGFNLPEIQHQPLRGTLMQQQQQLATLNGVAVVSAFAPQPPDVAPQPGRENIARRHSVSRRGTDHASSPLGAHATQQQHWPGSPASPSTPTCTSPVPRPMTGLPAVVHTSSSKSLYGSGGGGGSWMRPQSVSTLAPLTIKDADAAADSHACSQRQGSPFGYHDRYPLNGACMLSPSSSNAASSPVAAAATAAACQSFSQLQLPHTPMRARSTYMDLGSPIGGSPLGTADRSRRHSFRIPTRGSEAGIAAQSDTGRAEIMAPCIGSREKEGPSSNFKGTMYLI